MAFSEFANAVRKQFDVMATHGLFRVQIDKNMLWDNYLGSFPEGTNPIYKTRTEYDCQACRHFIRTVGDVVTIVDNQMVSIWDIRVENEAYQTVAKSMSDLIMTCDIDNVFLISEKKVGVAKNYQQVPADGSVIAWEHFEVAIPSDSVMAGAGIGPATSNFRGTKDVMQRSLEEISGDAVRTVQELISQGSLYRGEEHTASLQSFLRTKQEFDKLKTTQARSLWCWQKFRSIPPAVAKMRGTSIGTLLTDISEGRELDAAVASYEAKVAPTNYKRPTAVVTKAMISKAQETVESLGLTSALNRRYATKEDINVNNILFADHDTKKTLAGANVFDDLAAKVPQKMQNLDKVEEINIEKFIADVLPRAESLEIMFENRHASNLVSLIAPVDPDSKGMFKWPNKFSWSYAGELADSIKERVKRAGGQVIGDLRCSLSWYNFDDLDLHMFEAGGTEIYYAHKRSERTGGALDVDMNAHVGKTRSAVENIIYPDKSRMSDGNYRLFVNQFSKRESIDVGFEVEVEFDGRIQRMVYEKGLTTNQNVDVATIQYTKKDGFKVIKSLPSTETSKQVWNVPTQTFHKVNVVMFSPNYWDGHGVGNKHYFFMMEKCFNDGQARGFFNEFLLGELDQHRKVLEMVGSKMKTDESDKQLSGLGFSSTQRNHLMVKVSGSFNRTLKVTF